MAIYVNFEGMETASTELDTINQRFGEEMTTLNTIVTETTNNDWKGSDANAFVLSTKEKIEKVREEYNEYLNEIKSEINRNLEKFQNVQNSNMNMID
jgi:WXG100 family type VII secretion target